MRHPAWWLLAALLAGSAWALDPPRPGPAAEAPPEEAAPAGPAAQPEAGEEEAGAQDEPAEEDTAPPAPEARSTGPTPQRFDPSEKVRADFPVSFPIDI